MSKLHPGQAVFVQAKVDAIIDGYSHVAVRFNRYNTVLIDPACIIPLEDMCGACTQYPCSEHPLENVFNPVTFKAPNGDTLSVVMRDDGFELRMNDRPVCLRRVDTVSMTYPEGTIVFDKDSTGDITGQYTFMPTNPSMSDEHFKAFLERAKKHAQRRAEANKKVVPKNSPEPATLILQAGPDGKLDDKELRNFVDAIMRDMHKNTKEGPVEATAREGWHTRRTQVTQAIDDRVARIVESKAHKPGSIPHMLEQAERAAEQIKKAYGYSETPGKDTLISKSELIEREMRLIDQVKQVITHHRPVSVLQRIYDERVQEYRSIKRDKA